MLLATLRVFSVCGWRLPLCRRSRSAPRDGEKSEQQKAERASADAVSLLRRVGIPLRAQPLSLSLSLSLCTELRLIFFKNGDAVINRPIDWSVGGALTPVDL